MTFADGEWDSVSGSWMDVWFGGFVSSGPWYDCAMVPTADIYVTGGILNDLARSFICGTSTTVTQVEIVFDADGSTSWNWGSGTPGSATDGRSIAVHELGHTLGFTPHWQDVDASIDCSTTSRETMCSNYPGSTHWRSLEPHEEHTFAAKY